MENYGLQPHHEASVQSNLARGRITALSPLLAANAFVRRVRWTGTFAYGRYVGPAHVPLKNTPSRGGSEPHLGLTWLL